MRAAWLTAIALAGTFDTSGALGAPFCDSRANVLAHLEAKFAEQPIATGLANNGALIEVLTSEGGATWTIIVSVPGGATCLVAAGEDWQPLEPERMAGKWAL